MMRSAQLLILALTSSLCLLVDVSAATKRAKPLQPRKAGGQTTVAKPKSPSVDKPPTVNGTPLALPAPVVTELDLEGLKKLLARGDDPAKARPLLVNFWATWCDPCRDEFPDLVKVNNDYKDRGLDFAVVSGDEISEIKTGVPKFLREMRAGMTPYLLNVPDMAVAIDVIDPAWGGELPATYLYDRTGHVAFKHFGRVDPTELRAALDKVLAAN